MTVHRHARLIAITAIVAIALPTALAAQDATTPAKKAQHHHYKLIDMGTFGGPNSTINYPYRTGTLSSQGLSVGWSATPAPTTPTSKPKALYIILLICCAYPDTAAP